MRPKVYFDERIAEEYDAASAEMFEPSVVEPAVSFLAELAGDSAALELGVGHRPHRAAAQHAGRPGYDVVAQILHLHHYWVVGERRRLRERWGGWNREPFTSDSTSHVSVWTKTA
jgi:hypothetical protein